MSGPRISHLLWCNQVCATQLLILRSGARKLQLLSLRAAAAAARAQQCGAWDHSYGVAPTSHN